jgi:hypothetical protein
MNMKTILLISIVFGIFTISAVVASSHMEVIQEGSAQEKVRYGSYHDVDTSKMDTNNMYVETTAKATGIIKIENGGVSLEIENGTTHKKLKLDKYMTNWKDGENVTLYGSITNTDFIVEAVKYNN